MRPGFRVAQQEGEQRAREHQPLAHFYDADENGAVRKRLLVLSL